MRAKKRALVSVIVVIVVVGVDVVLGGAIVFFIFFLAFGLFRLRLAVRGGCGCGG